MNAIVTYLIQMTLCMVVLYGIYYILLRQEKMAHINRIVIWSILFLSLTIPLSPWHYAVDSLPIIGQFAFTLPTITITSTSEAITTGTDATLMGLSYGAIAIIALYFMGVFIRTIYLIAACHKLQHIISKGEHHKLDGQYTMVVTNETILPFSWLHYIILSKETYTAHNREIIAHERAHLNAHHSWDIILLQGLLLLFWFNPILWLIKQDLQDIHEYEADQEVLNIGIDATKYQLLLIQQATNIKRYMLVNALNHSSLKKRITMMQKQKSSKRAIGKVLWLLPVVVLMVLVISCTKSKKNEEMIPATKMEQSTEVNANSEVQQNQEEIFQVVEHMPEYPGGEDALMTFLSQNIKYPATAQKNQTEGRVIVQFIVDSKGNVNSPEIVRSVSPELDQEAIRVVKMMPTWQPGTQKGEKVSVKYTIPVSFKLQ